MYNYNFYHTAAELASQIADSQGDKSTYHTKYDKLFTCNHPNGRRKCHYTHKEYYNCLEQL